MKTVYIFPPSLRLLKFLAEEYIPSRHSDQRLVFIFPSRRSRLYFQYYLNRSIQEHSYALATIYTYAFEDLVDEFFAELESAPLMHFFDQIWELYTILAQKIKGVPTTDSFERFIPWGVHLVNAFEELEREGVELTTNITFPEGSPLAWKELSLSSLWHLWRERLKNAGKSTFGMRYRRCMEAWKKKIFPDSVLNSEIHFVGFVKFGTAEKEFLKNITEDVVIWIESDREDILEETEKFLRNHGFRFREISSVKNGAEIFYSTGDGEPKISFYEVPDRHHALEKLLELLDEFPVEPDKVAIIMPNEGMLMPLIHELSCSKTDIELNVTMGYPLSRSLVASFVLSLLELHSYRLDDGRFNVSSFIHLLRHPYSRILAKKELIQDGYESDEYQSLQEGISLIESVLIEYGSAYMKIEEIENLLLTGAPESGEPTGIEIFNAFKGKILSNFACISPLTIRGVFLELKQILQDIDRCIESHSNFTETSLENYKISLEQKFRAKFIETILDPVISSKWASERIENFSTVYRLVKEAVSVIRIPFSGDPLRGIQVLGFMESNLLTFDRVFILDANEGLLPPVNYKNPFLPEGVRRVLGLPDSESEANVTRCIFKRLVKSAGEVYIFYTSMSSKQRTSSSSFSLISSVRSRFVEELLWDISRKKGSIEEPINTVPIKIPQIILKHQNRVEKKAFSSRIENILSEPLSASILNTYLKCPLRFFYLYVLRLNEYESQINEGLEGRGYRELGMILHETMRNYLSRRKIIEDSNPLELIQIFNEVFDSSSLSKRLGAERRFFIKETVSYRLSNYLKWFCEKKKSFKVEDVERKVVLKNFLLTDREVTLAGILDLIGFYNDEVWIVDYKSSAPTTLRFDWNNIKELVKTKDYSNEDIFLEVRKLIGDIQLPFYGFIVHESRIFHGSKSGSPIRTCYHILGVGNSKEYEISMKESIGEISATFKDLLEFIVNHLRLSESFVPTDDVRDCTYCNYIRICPCALI